MGEYDYKVEKETILSGINSQISSFDNKASILISAIGIIFAVSLFFLDVFNGEEFSTKNYSYKVAYYILFLLFTLNTIASIGSYILVIIPRKKLGDNEYANYYSDIAKLNINEYEKYNDLLENYTKDDLLLTEQIIINSKICKFKHRWLKIGIILLIPCTLLLLSLTVFIIV